MSEALLVVDFINDIAHPNGAIALLGTPKHILKQHAIENTEAALKYARQKGTKVIFIKVTFAAGHPELVDTKVPFYRAHIENNWLVDGTWGTEFCNGLQPLPDEVVIEKHRVNPFTNPQLLKELQGIENIVIAGVATNFSVEETVRNAAALDFSVTVLEDCCASNNQEMHDFAIQQIFPKFAVVSSAKRW
jgi:nicotinamidase-related amidase